MSIGYKGDHFEEKTTNEPFILNSKQSKRKSVSLFSDIQECRSECGSNTGHIFGAFDWYPVDNQTRHHVTALRVGPPTRASAIATDIAQFFFAEECV